LPRTLSAERAARAAEVKRQRNRSVRTAIKTYISNAETAIASGDIEKAKMAVKEAISQVDLAVKGKVLHANTGARRKSNLMKKLNKAFGAQLLAGEVKKPVKKKATRRRTVKKTTAEKKTTAGKKTAAEKKTTEEKTTEESATE
jgi:small subunit ribosomal protein S20